MKGMIYLNRQKEGEKTQTNQKQQQKKRKQEKKNKDYSNQSGCYSDSTEKSKALWTRKTLRESSTTKPASEQMLMKILQAANTREETYKYKTAGPTNSYRKIHVDNYLNKKGFTSPNK